MMEIVESLSKSEEMVMAIIWDAESAPDLATVRKGTNEKYNKEWKPTTVSTFLTRLVRKGYLTSRRGGRYFYYEPAVSREEYCAAQITRMADLFFESDKDKLIEFISNTVGERK